MAGGQSSRTPRRAPAHRAAHEQIERHGSFTVSVPVDDSAASAGHPHPVAIDAAVEVAAVLVLEDESFESVADVSSRGHSITWSARSSTDCGMVRPSAFAVLRLITSSKRQPRYE
jgi:hypothetical protein